MDIRARSICGLDREIVEIALEESLAGNREDYDRTHVGLDFSVNRLTASGTYPVVHVLDGIIWSDGMWVQPGIHRRQLCTKLCRQDCKKIVGRGRLNGCFEIVLEANGEELGCTDRISAKQIPGAG